MFEKHASSAARAGKQSYPRRSTTRVVPTLSGANAASVLRTKSQPPATSDAQQLGTKSRVEKPLCSKNHSVEAPNPNYKKMFINSGINDNKCLGEALEHL